MAMRVRAGGAKYVMDLRDSRGVDWRFAKAAGPLLNGRRDLAARDDWSALLPPINFRRPRIDVKRVV
jgi:hypothetical protein